MSTWMVLYDKLTKPLDTLILEQSKPRPILAFIRYLDPERPIFLRVCRRRLTRGNP